MKTCKVCGAVFTPRNYRQTICSDNPIANAFCDALCIQADRILNNLQKHFTNMTEEEIKDIIFSDTRGEN